MQWISVEKELPEECENVLIWSKGMCVTGAYLLYDNGPSIWIINDWDESDRTLKLDDVSHWMPLPPTPKD